MSRFLSRETAGLAPYVPGEQPQDQRYNKLNTNESPFPPSPRVLEALSAAEIERLHLYSDPACAALCAAVADNCGLAPENVIPGNGSDELLSFAFRAFCGAETPAVYADITYGFYQVWARFYGLVSDVVPLREDFSLAADDYLGRRGTVFLANPNAPTGMALPAAEIGRILAADPDRVVVVDEAYADFGAESCVPLLKRYENLLVMQTFSKSRSLAGGRIGFALGSPALIEDMNRIKFSFNPYNLNRLSLLAGAAAMGDRAYFERCRAAIMENRAWTAEALESLGFTVLPSCANFLFVRPPRIDGGTLYQKLKARGVLVRHFDAPRIAAWCRITIGSRAQMEGLLREVRIILEEDAV